MACARAVTEKSHCAGVELVARMIGRGVRSRAPTRQTVHNLGREAQQWCHAGTQEDLEVVLEFVRCWKEAGVERMIVLRSGEDPWSSNGNKSRLAFSGDLNRAPALLNGNSKLFHGNS